MVLPHETSGSTLQFLHVHNSIYDTWSVIFNNSPSHWWCLECPIPTPRSQPPDKLIFGCSTWWWLWKTKQIKNFQYSFSNHWFTLNQCLFWTCALQISKQMPVSVSPGVLHLPKRSSHLLPSPSSSPEQLPGTFPDLLADFLECPRREQDEPIPLNPVSAAEALNKGERLISLTSSPSLYKLNVYITHRRTCNYVD